MTDRALLLDFLRNLPSLSVFGINNAAPTRLLLSIWDDNAKELFRVSGRAVDPSGHIVDSYLAARNAPLKAKGASEAKDSPRGVCVDPEASEATP